MENVFDIKYKQKLEYILPVDKQSKERVGMGGEFINQAAVIMYFYYVDTICDYFSYIDKADQCIKVYVVTPVDEVAKKITDQIICGRWKNVEIIMKPNRGRDITGLLIAAKSVINNYKYICYIHDKKSHFKETEDDVALWIENMWENLIGNTTHICNILQLFEENDQLGVLVPPAPVGKVFKVWYGYGWRDCFETTKQLAERLDLHCDLDESKPPITIGTTFWWRREALQKLFDYPWQYEDFDDNKLADHNYLSFAVERILAYVAQDADYTTGEIMTVEYAKEQTLFLQYSLSEIFRKMNSFYPFPTYENALCIDDNLQRLMEFVMTKEKILIYGVNDIGQFCAGYLRKLGREPVGFLEDEESELKVVDKIPVYSLAKSHIDLLDKGIVIATSNKNIQNEMIRNLKIHGIEEYCIFLQEVR